MDDLVSFLKARLDEQKAALIAYRDHRAGLTPCVNWAGQDPEDYTEWDSCSEHIRTGNATNYGGSVDYGMADIDAKRKLLDWLVECELAVCASDWRSLDVAAAIRALALPYADHDDYRDEWRP